MSATDNLELPASEEHRYFRAIEAVFVELRGAPLLLSPSDWRVAKGWFRQGISLDLVSRTLAEVFAKRRERGAEGLVSLRYCSRAIEAAWQAAQELGAAAASRQPETGLDLAGRLNALAEALPASLPDRDRWVAALGALAGQSGSEATESALEKLDRELVTELLTGLDDSARATLEGEADTALARLGDRLTGDERERARERLVRERLRRRWELPLLSLFAPEAVG